MVACDCFSSHEELTVHAPDVGFVNEVSSNESFQSDGWFDHVLVGNGVEIDFQVLVSRTSTLANTSFGRMLLGDDAKLVT